ncbi:MAG: nucleoside triphosphate pyrophosphohydrolase [Candidatus Spechtbacterales bacterium]|nr:nucleoside triphosphate pyrophosphohydrolase [Candidatus Spechtbacterales bacterium]
MTTKYNKLVRDKIPDYIRGKNGNPVYHIADDKEYWEKLKEKLLEEVNEFIDDESEEELADLLEVIDAILKYKGFKKEEIKKIRDSKAKERGVFKDKVILDES